MIELEERQQEIDLVTLTDGLHGKGMLDGADGVEYLSQLIDVLPAPVTLEDVLRRANIVRERAAMRKLIHSWGFRRRWPLIPN